MSKQAIKQLGNRNPSIRKSAIKEIAKTKDRGALIHLARMVGDDPDPEVRELARQAGVYIRQKLGDLPKPSKTPLKKGRVHVHKKNVKAATELINQAMTYQINGQDDKIIPLLIKALELDPNQRHEGYFISLCEGATGEEGAEAVEMLEKMAEDLPEKSGLLGKMTFWK